MKSLLADERDTSRENDNPVFRVFLVGPENGASAAFGVREARMDQVLARARPPDRSCQPVPLAG
ncbi:hypothetical protein [Paeniglutamicibacter kerguelensis]|uniref:Uncharacterized protein n=1 Tax=Paeniglutamicibacter kerguelensis TaxID=254788 RepID=A0ABS4XCC9_9MICC|nr:hypothetical protein [Paeniglutamicibacter kerguelensis]MBP2386043.1 hypothetical protein [Paeniglutamicibacter kerguelensis]